MVNSKKIKARLVELGLTQADIAKELRIATATVSQKINGVRPLSLDEAEKIANLLNIKDGEFRVYFFNQ